MVSSISSRSGMPSLPNAGISGFSLRQSVDAEGVQAEAVLLVISEHRLDSGISVSQPRSLPVLARVRAVVRIQDRPEPFSTGRGTHEKTADLAVDGSSSCDGGFSGTRTLDLMIKSHLLYQLS